MDDLLSGTSTVNDVVTNAYTYKYDVNGNIYLITDSAGQKIRYTYDDQNQLTREDNESQNKTFFYTYDYAGNRTSKKTYTYTIGSLTDLSYTEIKYEYTNDWGDQLTKVGSTSIAYDALGNPTTYNGYDLTWEGRQLMEMSMTGGQFRYTFEYNADGIRTAKYSNGTWHYYTLEGSRIVTESIGSKLLVYLYDESGSPIGLQYRQSSYAANQYDTFFFEKNIFGDIVAVYNENGDKIGSYTYDAWGICTTTTESGITVTERSIVRTYNPFRYRGYYYDTDTGLYYLQSRYYNPQWGRFLNADGYISTGTGLLGYNMYAYCNNNPVMYVDYTGEWNTTAFWVGVALTVLSVTVVSVVALVAVTLPILPATAALALIGGTALSGLAVSLITAATLDEDESLSGEQIVGMLNDTITGGINIALPYTPAGDVKTAVQVGLVVKDHVIPIVRAGYDLATGAISWDDFKIRIFENVEEDIIDYMNGGP